MNAGSLIEWWQHLPEHINPVAFSLGPITVYWYGLMYLVVFGVVFFLVQYRLKTEPFAIDQKVIGDFFLWCVIGVLIGGRLGYVLLYDLNYYLCHPLKIISPFYFSDGFRYTGIYGMSYHGGLVGALLTFFFYAHKQGLPAWRFIDLFVPAVPLGYTFGRVGNFINGELYGRITEVPWGMYFPLDTSGALRHPSQLYEAFFEGILLFLILWPLRKRKMVDGFLFCLYLMAYGIVRFLVEFVREPDAHVGFVIGSLSMGQVLCLGMIGMGGLLLLVRQVRARR